MSGGNWFSGGFTRAKELREAQASGTFDFGNNEKHRFWMKDGASRQVIFLDDFNWQVSIDGNTIPIIPFCRYEHKLELNGDWRNGVYLTCTKGASPCRPCEHQFKRVYFGAMTILDVTPSKDEKTGQMVVRPWKKLMVAPISAMAVIEAKKQKRGNLLGGRYSVARHRKQDPRVGSDFEFEETIADVRAHIKGLVTKEINLDPYGFSAEKAFEYYRKLFAPMPIEQQERMFNSGSVEDGSVMRPFAKKEDKPASSSPPAESSEASEGGETDAGEDVVPY
jgi:hypothetical protein